MRPGKRGAGPTVIGPAYPAVRRSNWKPVQFSGDQQQPIEEPGTPYLVDRVDRVVSAAVLTDMRRRSVGDIGQLICERTCPLEKEKLMASPTTLRSPYVLRLELVRDTLKSHSKLGDKEASALAEHVLHALNSIPEKMR